MTLPASGTISLTSIGTEIGQTITNMNDDHIRQLTGTVSSATIAMSALYSKTGSFTGNVGMSSSTTSNSGVSGQPFYNGTIDQIIRNAGNGNSEVDFSVAPTWTGNLILRNNTTAVQSTLTKQNSQSWQGSNPANLLRASTTDNFTIRPA